MTVNDEQVGGHHYQKGSIQPWDFVVANDLDFFQGNILKYLTRWKHKGGIADLEKARHYLEKYTETAKAGLLTDFNANAAAELEDTVCEAHSDGKHRFHIVGLDGVRCRCGEYEE